MKTLSARRGLCTGLVVLSLFTVACGDDSPSSPSPTPSPSPSPSPSPAPGASASLASIVIANNTATGAQPPVVTVTLAGAVNSDTNVALSSSNTAAVSVPASIVVPAGQTSASVNATANPVASNTNVTITATLGSSTQTAGILVVTGVLEALSFDQTTIRSQGTATGRVRLSAMAPPGGAVVTLESANTDVLKVPSTVTVPAGAITATFNADATTIRFSTTVTVNARYNGNVFQASVTVGPPELISAFTVKSDSKGSDDVCVIVPTGVGGLRMDCVLDASSSRGFPTRFAWTMRQGDKSVSWTSSEPSTRPPVDCGVLGGGSLNGDNLNIVLELVARNEDGVTGGTASRNVAFYPDGRCGY